MSSLTDLYLVTAQAEGISYEFVIPKGANPGEMQPLLSAVFGAQVVGLLCDDGLTAVSISSACRHPEELSRYVTVLLSDDDEDAGDDSDDGAAAAAAVAAEYAAGAPGAEPEQGLSGSYDWADEGPAVASAEGVGVVGSSPYDGYGRSDSLDEDGGSNHGLDFLFSLTVALKNQGFIGEATAQLLQSCLRGGPRLRKAFKALYDSYISGDMDIIALRDELVGLAVGLQRVPLDAGLQRDLVQYVNGLRRGGFLDDAESSMIRDSIAAGDARITQAYEAAEEEQDVAILHRGIMDVVRAFRGGSRSKDDDDTGAGAGAGLDGDDEYDDGDDAHEEAKHGAGSDQDDGGYDDEQDRRYPPRSRPVNPTPEANELMRIVEGMLNDGTISRDEMHTLRELITAEDPYVMAAFEVYEQDDEHDEEELKDTLIRVAQLHPSVPASANGGGGGSAPYPTAPLSKLVSILYSCKSISSPEAAGLQAAIQGEDPTLSALYSNYAATQEFAPLHAGVLAFIRGETVEGVDVTAADAAVAAAATAAAAAAAAAATAGGDDDASLDVDPDWPSGELAEDISAAQAALTAEMRAEGKISGADATHLRRLWAARDAAIRAAWFVYATNKDKSELEDSILRILARETHQADQSLEHLERVIRGLADRLDLLTAEERDQLLAVLPSSRQVIAAALDAYALDQDVEELVDTLKLAARHFVEPPTAAPAAPAAPAPSGTASKVTQFLLSQCSVLQETGKVSQWEGVHLQRLILERDPRVMGARDVYGNDGNLSDLRDTLARIAHLAADNMDFATRYSEGAEAGAAATADVEASSSLVADGQYEQTAELIDRALAQYPAAEAAAAKAALGPLIRAGDLSISAAVDVYRATDDLEDFGDTLVRVAAHASDRRGKKVGGAGGGVGGGAGGALPPQAYPLTDADKDTLDAAAQAMQLKPSETAALRQLVATDNEFVAAAVEAFNEDQDEEELRDTLRRIIQRSHSPSAPSPAPRILSSLAAQKRLGAEELAAALRLHRSNSPELRAAIAQYDETQDADALETAVRDLIVASPH